MELFLLTTPFNFLSRKKNKTLSKLNLKRAHSHLDPRPIFYIFCEGKRTEPCYFRALKDSLTPKSNVNVKFPFVGAVPHVVASRAVEYRKEKSVTRKGMKSLNKNDQVWAVFDRDKHPNFDEAIKKCKENGVLVGRSNPCFEVWLILHLEDYGAQDDSKNVKKRYRELLQTKTNWEEKNHYHNLVGSVETAEARAIKQMNLRRQEGDEFGIPSTTVGQLTAVIRETNEQYSKKSHSKSKLE